MYIDDCVEGTLRIMDERHRRAAQPRQRPSSSPINQLVDIVEEIAGVKLERRYQLDAPQGVRGRNSDNTLIQRAPRLGAAITLEAVSSRPTAGSRAR